MRQDEQGRWVSDDGQWIWDGNAWQPREASGVAPSAGAAGADPAAITQIHPSTAAGSAAGPGPDAGYGGDSTPSSTPVPPAGDAAPNDATLTRHIVPGVSGAAASQGAAGPSGPSGTGAHVAETSYFESQPDPRSPGVEATAAWQPDFSDQDDSSPAEHGLRGADVQGAASGGTAPSGGADTWGPYGAEPGSYTTGGAGEPTQAGGSGYGAAGSGSYGAGTPGGYGAGGYGPAPQSAPAYGAPAHGAPGYGAGGHGAPAQGAPGSGAPGSGAAGSGAAGSGAGAYDQGAAQVGQAPAAPYSPGAPGAAGPGQAAGPAPGQYAGAPWPPPGGPAAGRARRGRPAWLIPLIAALIVIGVAVGVFFLLTSDDKSSSTSSATPLTTTSAPQAPSTGSSLPTGLPGTFPVATEQNFMNVCQAGGANQAYCACALTALENEFSQEEFGTFEQQYSAGDPTARAKLQQISNSCRSQLPGG